VRAADADDADSTATLGGGDCHNRFLFGCHPIYVQFRTV